MSNLPWSDALSDALDEWFLSLFVLMWFVMSGLLSLISGWWGLASRFRSEKLAHGDSFRFVSGSIGSALFPVSYGSCLFVTINEEGFRVAILFLFRFLSPPLLIPWSKVESVIEKRFFFMRYAAIRIRENWPVLSFCGKAGKRILETYARVR